MRIGQRITRSRNRNCCQICETQRFRKTFRRFIDDHVDRFGGISLWFEKDNNDFGQTSVMHRSYSNLVIEIKGKTDNSINKSQDFIIKSSADSKQSRRVGEETSFNSQF